MGRLLAWIALRNLAGYADESKKAGLDVYFRVRAAKAKSLFCLIWFLGLLFVSWL